MTRSGAGRGAPAPARREPANGDAVTQSMVVRAEQQSEQRFGSAARRDPGRGGVCVLRLTIAGPSERISRSAPKMKQLEATEAQLRAQIAELEQQKVELADPVYIAAQARQRLGFVMPGDVTYQVRLPSAEGGDALRARR